MRRYRPRKLAAPVTVLHTPLSTTLGGRDLGWARHVTGPLRTRPIPGEHQYIFTEPAVHGLATALADELERLGYGSPAPAGGENLPCAPPGPAKPPGPPKL